MRELEGQLVRTDETRDLHNESAASHRRLAGLCLGIN